MHFDCQCHWWFCSIWNITLFPPRASTESRERLTSILGSKVWNGWVNNLPPTAVKSWKENISVESSAGLIVLSTPAWSLQLPWIFLSVLCNDNSSVKPALICSLQLPCDRSHWKRGRIRVLYAGAAVMTHQKCPVCIPGMMVLGFTVPRPHPCGKDSSRRKTLQDYRWSASLLRMLLQKANIWLQVWSHLQLIWIQIQWLSIIVTITSDLNMGKFSWSCLHLLFRSLQSQVQGYNWCNSKANQTEITPQSPKRAKGPRLSQGIAGCTCPACKAAAVAGDRVTPVRVAAVTTLAAVKAICSILQEQK